ncbi:MAG: hypothetical protein HYW06_06710, partial [Gemmatimonadetes bacterium]|nr:hypothetical protein [Gemmatimonadota bacterium]
MRVERVAALEVSTAGDRRDHAPDTRLPPRGPDFADGDGAIQAGDSEFEA